MNIFKILQNGAGRINEANVSAFLGYLLDPGEDHGLKYVFLEKFLSNVNEIRPELEYFNPSKFSFEVFFEQAAKDKDKNEKKVIDIILACYEINSNKNMQSGFKDTLDNKRSLKFIFLIENKISKDSMAEEQLKEQYNNATEEYGEQNKSKLYTIYVTPNDEKFKTEFNNFNENEKKIHIFWKNDSTDATITILDILKDIISKQSSGEIDPLHEYTRHTLISFIQFIENDFKSQKIELQENFNKKDVYTNFEDFKKEYPNILNQTSFEILQNFLEFQKNQFPDLSVKHSKTHPISVFRNDKRIFTCSTRGQNLVYNLVFPTEKNTSLKNAVIKMLNEISIKENDNGWAITVKDSKEQMIDINLVKSLFAKYLEVYINTPS